MAVQAGAQIFETLYVEVVEIFVEAWEGYGCG
jgi:hypothetical protein